MYVCTVVPSEVVVEAVSDVNITEGDIIALNCSTDGSLPPTSEIQWLRNRVEILRQSNRVSIETPPPQRDQYGFYLQTSTLTISDTNSEEDSGLYTCRALLRTPGIPTVTGNLVSINVQGVHSESVVHSILYLLLTILD